MKIIFAQHYALSDREFLVADDYEPPLSAVASVMDVAPAPDAAQARTAWSQDDCEAYFGAGMP